MNQDEQIKALLDKYRQGTATPEETAWLESVYLDWNKQHKRSYSEDELSAINSQAWQSIIVKANLDPTDTTHTKPVRLWPRIAIAAAIAVIIFGAGLFYFNSTNKLIKPVGNETVVNDIAPGKQGATLTLANGMKIRLSDAANGNIAKEAGFTVTKTADGQIIYEMRASESTREDLGAMNTLTTAKGETYMLILPDKSKVWLNAASSLTYAASLLQGGVRTVQLHGEAYFEISKDKKHPFIVKTGKQKVEVLGTHFNINAYADESNITTTLLEGSVKISNAARGLGILKPGQQAVLSDKGIILKDVETEDAIDWKEGYFMFNNETLESGMKRIARWYNVQIVYEDEGLKEEAFFGRISKFEKISNVLGMLERTDIVVFKIENGRIIVSRKK